MRAHPGREWLVVLSGTAVLMLGHRRYRVETNQAAEFPTMTPHAIGAEGGPCEILGIFDRDARRGHQRDTGDRTEGAQVRGARRRPTRKDRTRRHGSCGRVRSSGSGEPCRQSLTIIFPVLSPRRTPRNASRLFSMPSTTVSRYFSSPERTQAPTSWTNCGWRS